VVAQLGAEVGYEPFQVFDLSPQLLYLPIQLLAAVVFAVALHRKPAESERVRK